MSNEERRPDPSVVGQATNCQAALRFLGCCGAGSYRRLAQERSLEAVVWQGLDDEEADRSSLEEQKQHLAAQRAKGSKCGCCIGLCCCALLLACLGSAAWVVYEQGEGRDPWKSLDDAVHAIADELPNGTKDSLEGFGYNNSSEPILYLGQHLQNSSEEPLASLSAAAHAVALQLHNGSLEAVKVFGDAVRSVVEQMRHSSATRHPADVVAGLIGGPMGQGTWAQPESCDFEFPGGRAACFCQLAGNAACAGEPCACDGGCDKLTWRSNRTTTFQNQVDATRCNESAALLTVPEGFFENVDFALRWCPRGAHALLLELMESGFRAYQELVKAGPVKQCVHAPAVASVQWLHIHTFCAGGTVDGLWNTTGSGWCASVNDTADIASAVDALIAWTRQGSRDDPLPSEDVDLNSCASRSCGGQEAPRPLCTCDPRSCGSQANGSHANGSHTNGTQGGRCCPDFKQACEDDGEVQHFL